jgi:hypothetical protein
MAWFQSLVERFVNTGSYNQKMEISDEGDVEDLFKGVSDQNIWKVINKIREINQEREDKIKDYDKMLKDSVIQSAVELMADDATQTDREKEVTVWIESDDGDKFAEDVNEWLQDTVKIENHIWTYAYNAIKYGEISLKTYKNDEKFQNESNKEVGEYFKLITNPLEVNELVRYGEVEGYYAQEDDKGIIYPPDEYIHFLSDRGYNREEVSVVRNEGTDEEELEHFTIRYGTSFIDAARSAYRTLNLMEDIITMSRVVRSAVYRLFQIEVGNSSRKETLKIINEVKRSIESRETFSKMEDLYESNKSPLPMNSNVYSPKRNNKGDIQIESVGGNVDVKDIVDIEYFRNKLFAALKIPKSFLGFDEEMPGNMGNGSALTKLDIRYARTVKRVQSVLKAGIKEMVEFYLNENDKKDKIGKFKVRMTTISSSEDEERTNALSNKVNAASSISDFVDRNFDSLVKERDFLVWLVEEIIGLDGLKEVIKTEEEIKEDSENDDGGGGSKW